MLYTINQNKLTFSADMFILYLQTLSSKVEEKQARPRCGDAKLVMRKCGALLNEAPSAESF